MTTAALISTDGSTWTQVQFPAITGNLVGRVRFVSGIFIVMSDAGELLISSDGAIWTTHSITGYPSGVPLFRDVAYTNGQWVFNTVRSNDSSAAIFSKTSDFSTWAHTASSYLSNYLFHDGQRYILPGLATSYDAETWIPATGIPAADHVMCAAIGGADVALIAGDATRSRLFSSSDGGRTWDVRSEYFYIITWNEMAYGNGLFVAVSSDDFSAVYKPSQESGVVIENATEVISYDPSLVFFAEVSGRAQSQNVLMLKNAKEAWTYNGTTLSKITDADYPGWSVVTPSSIIRSGAVATVTLPAATNWQSGSSVTIAGAAQAEYNGTFVINVTDSAHLTFPVTGTPASPATGAITAKGGRTTVPGIVYLDGYFFVMDENAVIYNCVLGEPTSWNALDFITANIEPGSGVAIAKAQNYIIALKSWSTEFFYDAGNPVGSPLSPVMNAFTLIGCASGDSVANIDGTIAWVSKTRQKGRAVHIMAGLEQQKVSTPDIERILNADSLANVYSYGVKISGHVFYVLGLKDSGLTLVYDFTSQSWALWTSMTARAAKSCTIVSDAGIATAICAAHGLADGDPVTIAGAAQAEYNGTHQARYVDADTFKFAVAGAPASPATGTITATGYDETYFKFTKYVYCSGRDLVLHETTGELCEITEAVYQDSGQPINFLARTGKIDGDSIERKTNSQLKVIGNKIGGIAMVRWSDDDYTTSSAYRPIDLSSEQARLSRLGSFRRRSYELRHVGNSPVQVSALELEISKEK